LAFFSYDHNIINEMNNCIKLLAGNSNKPLANAISRELGIKLTDCVVEKFPNTEIRVEINENVRGCIMFIIQSGGSNNIEGDSINDYIMETLLLIDACKRSGANKVNVFFALLPYSRSDKKDKSRVPIAGALISRILESAGADRIICMDLHASQIQGFTTLPFDNLYAINLHIKNLKSALFDQMSNEHINENYVLVSLDVGGSKRVKEYAKRLNMNYALMDKQRDYSKPGTVLKSVLVGDVKNKTAICIDDMCDTCGTMVAGINDLKSHGAKDAIVVVTHGIFSGIAIARINECDFVKEVRVIDTLDQTENIRKCNKITVVGSSWLFAQVIKRLVDGDSISELFE